ncbi:MAG: hypothetical protein R3D67_16365 [Hyphomicrobiaceae bacterium]
MVTTARSTKRKSSRNCHANGAASWVFFASMHAAAAASIPSTGAISRRGLYARGGTADAGNGDLVRFEILSRHRGGVPEARVAEVLGNPNDERQISLIAVHAYGIQTSFRKPS